MTRVGVVAGCAAVALIGASFVARGERTPTATVTEPHTVDGAQLFRSKGCATCHTGPDSTARFEVAPSLADAASWAANREPDVSAIDYLAESILAPSTFISPVLRSEGGPGGRMPDLGLSQAEVGALIDYLLHP